MLYLFNNSSLKLAVSSVVISIFPIKIPLCVFFKLHTHFTKINIFLIPIIIKYFSTKDNTKNIVKFCNSTTSRVLFLLDKMDFFDIMDIWKILMKL